MTGAPGAPGAAIAPVSPFGEFIPPSVAAFPRARVALGDDGLQGDAFLPTASYRGRVGAPSNRSPRQRRQPAQPRPPLSKRLRPVHWTVLDCVTGAGLGLLALGASQTAVGGIGGTGFALLFRVVLGVAIFVCVGFR